MVILVVLGGGGHTFEMLMLLRSLNIENKVYALNHDDTISQSKVRGNKIVRIARPREPAEYSVKLFFKAIVSLMHAFLVLLYIRPKAVLTNGPAIGAIVGLVAKILHIPVIYVESICRVKTLSLTGRILLPLASIFIVQWPKLRKYSKKILYGGRIF